MVILGFTGVSSCCFLGRLQSGDTPVLLFTQVPVFYFAL
jgi:hypothetical protein